jgi:peroxiredoxin
MAVASTMLELGTPAPDFTLTDVVTGDSLSRDDFGGVALVVMFICNHCPYVQHVQDGLAAFGRDYRDADVSIVAVSSNDATAYPDDAPEPLAEVAEAKGYAFPLLYDASQEVAKAYGAACTPDFFVFGPDRTLVYRGQFDGSRPGNDVPVTGESLRAAVDAILAGEPVPPDQRPSLGCSIKWKSGNEPFYFG